MFAHLQYCININSPTGVGIHQFKSDDFLMMAPFLQLLRTVARNCGGSIAGIYPSDVMIVHGHAMLLLRQQEERAGKGEKTTSKRTDAASVDL